MWQAPANVGSQREDGVDRLTLRERSLQQPIADELPE